MEPPQWYLDITNPEIPVKFDETDDDIFCHCCNAYLSENTDCYQYNDYNFMYPACFCLKCVNNNLKEFYERDELNLNLNSSCKWTDCYICNKSGCLCADPVVGVQFVKDNYKFTNTSKYKSNYITDHYCDIVNIEKPKILTPVDKISDVFKNTYIKIDIDCFLIGVNIGDSSLLDLVSITSYDPDKGLYSFDGFFLINANPESKDYKRIAIYIINNSDYYAIMFNIDEDLDTFTYNYQEYMKNKSCTKWYLDPVIRDLYDDVDYYELLVEELDQTLEKEGFIYYAKYYMVSNKLPVDFSFL